MKITQQNEFHVRVEIPADKYLYDFQSDKILVETWLAVPSKLIYLTAINRYNKEESCISLTKAQAEQLLKALKEFL